MKNVIIKIEDLEALNEMTNEDRGKLFSAILEYHKNEDEPELSWMPKFAFKMMKPYFDLNIKNYKTKCESNRINWAKWWRPKKEYNKNPKNPDGFFDNPKNLKSKSKSKSKSIISKEISSKNIKNFSEKSFEYKTSFHFLKSKAEFKQVQTIVKNKWWWEFILQEWSWEIEKLKRIDWLTEEEIEKICNFAMHDSFWKKNILSIEKLRKKNKENIPFWAVLKDKAFDWWDNEMIII